MQWLPEPPGAAEKALHPQPAILQLPVPAKLGVATMAPVAPIALATIAMNSLLVVFMTVPPCPFDGDETLRTTSFGVIGAHDLAWPSHHLPPTLSKKNPNYILYCTYEHLVSDVSI
jgi:hypothetical protein